MKLKTTVSKIVLSLGLTLSISNLYAFDYEDGKAPKTAEKIEADKKLASYPLGNTTSTEVVNNVEIVEDTNYKKQKFTEVRNFVIEAAKYCKEVGNKTCLEEFNKKESKWVDGNNKYIWAVNYSGIVLAHPKKGIKDKSVWEYEDKEGNLMYQKFIKVAEDKGYGWIDFSWSHPQTGKIVPKTTFVITIGDNQLIGADIYK